VPVALIMRLNFDALALHSPCSWKKYLPLRVSLLKVCPL